MNSNRAAGRKYIPTEKMLNRQNANMAAATAIAPLPLRIFLEMTGRAEQTTGTASTGINVKPSSGRNLTAAQRLIEEVNISAAMDMSLRNP